MSWMKIAKITAISYSVLLPVGLLFPRKWPKDQIESTNFLRKLFRDLLYLSGGPEFIGNLLLFIPVFIALIWALGRNMEFLSALICVMTSVTAEFIQKYIPGRVSTVRDIFLNSLGVLIALLLYLVFFKKTLKPQTSQ